MRFVAIGSAPELGSSWMLPRIIGFHRAKEMMLTGRIYSAEEALELGLVHRLTEPDRLMPEAIALAQEIAANPEPTLRTVKRMMWEDLTANGDESTWRRSTENITNARKTAEYREGMLAFAEKRPPRYHDREYMAALRAQLEQGSS
jgi:2-(1,2-epoxy-1,2-dihydrophenyl)acetyl-CoA isomerase